MNNIVNHVLFRFENIQMRFQQAHDTNPGTIIHLKAGFLSCYTVNNVGLVSLSQKQ